MQDLKPKHILVARYMALGIGLQEICMNLNLNYDSWQQTVRQPLFQEKIHQLSEEIEDRLVDSAVDDPVLAKLKFLAKKAVDTLENEMGNMEPETGGTAATRIRASDSILDRVGYGKNVEKPLEGNTVVILSGDKISSIQRSLEKVLATPALVQ